MPGRAGITGTWPDGQTFTEKEERSIYFQSQDEREAWVADVAGERTHSVQPVGSLEGQGVGGSTAHCLSTLAVEPVV